VSITIFGATGGAGHHLVEQALVAGYEVVAFARTPSRLGIQHERLEVVQGDVQNIQQVERVVAGSEAVLSVLAPTSNKPDFQITTGTQNIVAAMEKHDLRRLIVSAGAGVSDPNDEPKLFNKMITLLLKLFSQHVYEDMKRTVATVRASNLDWTIVRVPMLNDGPQIGHVRVGYVGKGVGARLSRADLAAFILKELKQGNYLHQAPVISN
jgi:putative NADH-flavin reductase